MTDLNRRLPHVDSSRFSMIPRAEIPRSTFVTEHALKTTFTAGYLIPFHIDEVLPADVHQGQVTIFARLATPLFPIMDNMTLETFFFFVPSRLVWDNWKKMMGERTNPLDSISYTIPQLISPAGGFVAGSIYDYFGLPTAGQITGANTVTVNALPLRAFNLIYNTWFRDENLQTSLTVMTNDGPDDVSYYLHQARNKRHDYFTSALPWPIKGGQDVTLPISGNANVLGIGYSSGTVPTAGAPASTVQADGSSAASWPAYYLGNTTSVKFEAAGTTTGSPPKIYADLSTATGQTINAIRLAFQTQRLLERDARGGTRYTELLRAHFGVLPEDARLQRPEYIGGGRTSIQTSAIPQTSATGLTGGSSPLGALGAAATAADQHSFSYHATEHGYIIGIVHVTADLTYQQGLHRMWTRRTRYDFYWPAFAHLGEQPIRNDEIYAQGTAADTDTFGYQERWAEYRHRPSRITGKFRSTTTGSLDAWHLAINFGSLPALNSSFIQDAPPLSRALAAGAAADGQQVLLDSVFRIKSTRPLPMFSVPGEIDRF